MQTEKAKSSHFDRTRVDKNQIFPTLAIINQNLIGLISSTKGPNFRFYGLIVFWNDLEFIKPQNLGSLLIKSSQSNFDLRSPSS